MNTRELVLELLTSILDHGKYGHLAIRQALDKNKEFDKLDRSFITRLCEGTIERCLTLDVVIATFSSVKLEKMKPFVRNILRMGTYQLLFMDQVPDSAACNESVKLAKKRGLAGLSGFINGVLRSIARDKDILNRLEGKLQGAKRLSFRYSIPEWIVEDFLLYYGEEKTLAILNGFFRDRPTSIRCNLSRMKEHDPKNPNWKKKIAAELTAKLIEEGVTVAPGNYLPEALLITGYDSLDRLECFKQGLFQVQDEASMMAGLAASVNPGDFVLDVCAAPGGKALHLADMKAVVEARDLSERKVGLILDNIKRSQLTGITAKVWDALKSDEMMEKKADVLLADLPCSGLGVLGNKPDIRYRMSKKQQEELVVLQRNILKVVQAYVKPGGILIYSTCTINPKENEEMAAYLVQNFGFALDSLNPYIPSNLHTEQTAAGYLQLLPGIHQTDGFFLARLLKLKDDD